VLFVVLIGVLFALILWNLLGFIPAVLGAYTLYVMLRWPLEYLTVRQHWHKSLAAGVLMLGSLALIALPVHLIFQVLGNQVSALMHDPQAVWQKIESVAQGIETRYGVQIITPTNLKTATDWATAQTGNLMAATANSLWLTAVAFLLLWFMLARGRDMEAAFLNWLPMQTENVRFVRKQLNDLVFSNAIGIPLMGAVQGIAALLAYWAVGVPDFAMWAALTFVAGMMPLFGAMLAYIPLGLILLAGGDTWIALFVFVYGVVVIGSVDNIARMWVLNKICHAHPLVTFFGVLLGLKMFGFIGFVFGPILISLVLLLAQIYEKEFNAKVQITVVVKD